MDCAHYECSHKPRAGAGILHIDWLIDTDLRRGQTEERTTCLVKTKRSRQAFKEAEAFNIFLSNFKFLSAGSQRKVGTVEYRR